MDSSRQFVRSAYDDLELHDLLMRPVEALLGVSADAVRLLQQIGVHSVFDLGASSMFAKAEAAADAAAGASVTSRFGLAASDWLVPAAAWATLEDIGDLPIETLRGFEGMNPAEVRSAFDAATIRDLANWPPRRAAKHLIGSVTGAAQTIDELQTERLRPRFAEYPTGRVYYNTLMMLQMPEAKNAVALSGPISVTAVDTRTDGFDEPAVGVQLTLSQSWYAQGLTLGDLLHCLALAPGEATRVAVVDWKRRDRSSDTESIVESESLDNAASHGRAVSEVQTATAQEMQRGGSTAFGMAFSASQSEQSSASSGLIPGLFGGGSSGDSSQSAMSTGMAVSAGWSAGSRQVAASLAQNVNDTTEQHSTAVRNRRATRVREVSQSEHSEVSTRVVANYNHMHALTVQYYEVVQIFRTVTELQRAERVLFIPVDVPEFTPELVERFRWALWRAALSDRIRQLLVDPQGAVAVQPKVNPQLGPNIIPGHLNIPREIIYPVAPTAGPQPNPEEATSPVVTPVLPINVSFRALWTGGAIDNVARVVAQPLRRSGSDALHLPPDMTIRAVTVEGMNLKEMRFDRAGTVGIPLGAAGTGTFILPDGVKLSDIDGLSAVKTDDAAASGTVTLQGEYKGQPIAVPIPASLDRGTAVQRVSVFLKDTADRQSELLQHLRAHHGHYSQAILHSLDHTTVVLLLSKYKWNGKVLAHQIEPRPIAVIGNYLAFRAPVEGNEASGVTDEHGKPMGWQDLLNDRHITRDGQFVQKNERLIPIPTGGVFAEAVLGRSNSAEKLDITRFWNWQDSPIPLTPTEIAPPTTASRHDGQDTKAGALGQPVLNIVNPTALPEPGAGTAGLLAAIANGNMFRDMSGLAGTQAAVASGMKGTLQAATDAGQIASSNLRTEAQKMVAMGQTWGEIAKAAMAAMTGGKSGGGGSGGAKSGISGDGARINHGKDMDSRGIGTRRDTKGGGSSIPGPRDKTGGGATSSTGTASSNGYSDSNGYSSELAYSDTGAFGYSPDAMQNTADGAAQITNEAENAADHDSLSADEEFVHVSAENYEDFLDSTEDSEVVS